MLADEERIRPRMPREAGGCVEARRRGAAAIRRRCAARTGEER